MVLLYCGKSISILVHSLSHALQAKIIARFQALLTELVFEHSLRIRMKAAVPEGEDSRRSTSPYTPDTASLSEADSTLDGATSTSDGDESTVQGSNGSTNTNPSKSKVEKEGARKTSQPDPAGSNLVGKINNLVSTDLQTVMEARDFFLIVAYVPIQISLCILFLYTLLGWRCVFDSLLLPRLRDIHRCAARSSVWLS